MTFKKIWIIFTLLMGVTIQDIPAIDMMGYASAVDQWEKRAVNEAKKKYPLANVLFKQKVWDRYREKEAVKQYHITLKDQTKEFGVFVTISYNPHSNKVNKIIVVEEYSE